MLINDLRAELVAKGVSSALGPLAANLHQNAKHLYAREFIFDPLTALIYRGISRPQNCIIMHFLVKPPETPAL
jgi:hypothetical protein